MTRRSVLGSSVANSASLLGLIVLIGACSGSTAEPTPTVASVEVSPTSASPQIGQTVQLSAAVKDAAGNLMQGQSVTWSSSVASVASVSSAGLVTAAALGSATITGSAGGRTGSAAITVIPEPIASIVLDPTLDTLLIGQTVQLSATMRNAAGNVVTDRNIAWSTVSPNVATVSSSGLVTATGEGVATVTATADGRTAAATIRVFGPCSIALAPVITVGQTIDGTLSTTDCQLDDDTYADGYSMVVSAATAVQIDMTASYDTYLFLLELLPSGNLVQRAENDDVDPDDPNDPNDPVDTNSRIVFNLVAGSQYFILANSFDPDVTGDYQLKVTAVAGAVSARQAGYTKPGKAPWSKIGMRVKGRG
jgi:hypothetical protein